VEVRFLQLTDRRVGRLRNTFGKADDESNLELVDFLEIDGQIYQSWQEAVERRLSVESISLELLLRQRYVKRFHFLASKEVEFLSPGNGPLAGVILRRQEPIEIAVEMQAVSAADGLFRIIVKVANDSHLSHVPLNHIHSKLNADDSLQSLASTHTILSATQGQFVSLLDPPAQWHALTKTLHNEGTWPTLVGEENSRNMLLCSPIILYDYPQVAAESPGDLFDATEIDEILSLRIMTLTDEERQQAGALDTRVRDLLARTNSLSDQQLGNLHGTLRGLRPITSTE
jgi:hypothetical protein